MMIVRETISQVLTRDILENGKVIISHTDVFGAKNAGEVLSATKDEFGPFDSYKDAARFAENPSRSDRLRLKL